MSQLSGRTQQLFCGDGGRLWAAKPRSVKLVALQTIGYKRFERLLQLRRCVWD